MKEEKADEMKWKVEEAIDSFTRYKKIVDDEKVKEKVIQELKKRANEYKDLAKKL